jgi:hypothetical protein
VPWHHPQVCGNRPKESQKKKWRLAAHGGASGHRSHRRNSRTARISRIENQRQRGVGVTRCQVHVKRCWMRARPLLARTWKIEMERKQWAARGIGPMAAHRRTRKRKKEPVTPMFQFAGVGGSSHDALLSCCSQPVCADAARARSMIKCFYKGIGKAGTKQEARWPFKTHSVRSPIFEQELELFLNFYNHYTMRFFRTCLFRPETQENPINTVYQRPRLFP